MTCTHLKEISRVCEDNGLKLGRTDLVRVVCGECGEQEVCPANSVELEERDASPAIIPEATRSMNVHVNSSVAPESK